MKRTIEILVLGFHLGLFFAEGAKTEMAGTLPFTGLCQKDSLTCKIDLLGGTATISPGPMIILNNLDGVALGRFLSVAMAGKISGSIETKKKVTQVELHGARLSGEEILDQLPTGLASVTGLTKPLTEMVESPQTLTARLISIDEGYFVRNLKITNDGGQLIGKDGPFRTNETNLFTLRWFPKPGKLPKDIATSLTDPDGQTSLTLHASISLKKARIDLDNDELKRKGGKWLGAKIRSFDRKTIEDAIKKLRF